MAILIGIVTTLIGALPLGLVNLSVVSDTIKGKQKEAMQLAWGAALVEMLYVFAALLFGRLLNQIIEVHDIIQYIVSGILLLIALFFFIKQYQPKEKTELTLNGFLKGIFLNLLSIQVLVYWVIAITYLINKEWLLLKPGFIGLFISSVVFTKVLVLKGYAIMARKVVGHSQAISRNINLVIGMVLVLSALYYLF